MTVTVKNIIPPKQAEAAQTTQYTASNCKTLIDKFTVTNTTATAATFAANLVPYGGTAGDSNLVLKTRTIAAGERRGERRGFQRQPCADFFVQRRDCRAAGSRTAHLQHRR